jgi:hypothetical protein
MTFLVSEQEHEVIRNHCSAEGYTISEFLRNLIRVHLGLDDFKNIMKLKESSWMK